MAEKRRHGVHRSHDKMHQCKFIKRNIEVELWVVNVSHKMIVKKKKMKW